MRFSFWVSVRGRICCSDVFFSIFLKFLIFITTILKGKRKKTWLLQDSFNFLKKNLSIFKPTQSWQDNPNPKGLPMYPIVVESKIVRLTIESIPTANHYFSRAVYQIEFLSRQWKSLLKTRCCNWMMILWHWN